MTHRSRPYSNEKRRPRARGFALISTIIIASLLMMLAMAMLSLNSVETRSSQTNRSQLQAQANARMALLLALGELQQELGSDQRISANSAIFAADESGKQANDQDFDSLTIDSNFAQPYLLGAWDSWSEWLSEPSIADTYTQGRQQKFRGMLISHPNREMLLGENGIETARTGFGDLETIKLYSNLEGTKTPFKKEVVAPYVATKVGGIAWHIAGQNMKALITAPTNTEEQDSLSLSAAQLSNKTFHGIGKGIDASLEDFPTDKDKLFKVISLSNSELLENKVDYFIKNKHDYTGFSESLVVNVRKGGFKKDINSLLELEKLPSEYSGINTGSPDNDDPVSIRPSEGTIGSAQYYAPSGKHNLSSWYKLHQYYQLYRGDKSFLDESSKDQCNMNSPYFKGLNYNNGDPLINFNWHDGNLNQRSYGRTPIVARNLIEMGLKKEGIGDDTKYYLMMNPVVTMWNPYNVPMITPKAWTLIQLGEFQMKIWKDGVMLADWTNMDSLNFNIFTMPGRGLSATPKKLLPGEALIYSATPGVLTAAGNLYVELYPGYEPFSDGGGVKRDLSLLNSNLKGAGNYEVAIRVNDQARAHGGNHQFYWTTRNEFNGAKQRFNEMAANPIEPGKPIEIISENPGERLKLSNTSSTKKFCNFGFSLKVAESLNTEEEGNPYAGREYRGKNFLYSRAWTNRSMYGQPSDRMKSISQYELFFDRVSGNGGNTDIEKDTNRGFIMSSHLKQGNDYDGQTFAPLAEIPVSPTYSLASFQGFSLEPGFASFPSGFHLWEVNTNNALGIGSSYASPLLAQDKVYNRILEAASGGAENLSQMKHLMDAYDHIYMNNDALFDEWFCSSLTPQDTQTFTDKRDLSKVYDEFTAGTKLLPNNSLTFHGNADTLKAKLVSGNLPAADAYKNIGQHLKIKGGFNVNSISVDAWKALFYSLKQDSVQYIDVKTGKITIKKLAKPEVVLSRMSLPCAAEEGDDANDPNAWRGIRFLTNTQIDKLARECVRQVRLRGPFLNMSDFVNRRLDPSNEETSLCGALQAAIDWDEFNGNKPTANDVESINSRFKNSDEMITDANQKSWVTHSDLPFAKAFEGSRWTAIPGYVTQVDLLKRIGNNIVVRDDTFIIRAYGDARDNNGKITATAYCEAVVSRGIDFVDDTQIPATATTDLNDINKRHGRKFVIKSFKWLSNKEL